MNSEFRGEEPINRESNMMITVGARQEVGSELYPTLKNLDTEMTTFRVKAEVYFAGLWHDLPSDHYYGGRVFWTLQGEGTFSGSLGLEGLCKEWNIGLLGVDAWVRVSISEPEEEGSPCCYWRFNGLGRWIAEPDHSKAPE